MNKYIDMVVVAFVNAESVRKRTGVHGMGHQNIRSKR